MQETLSNDQINARLMRRATYGAVGVALTLVSLKAFALALTGSVAMLGNLFDSLLDGSASLVNLFAVRHALTPADQEHRFGHGKAEALAGLAQSVFIFGSASYILFEAVNRYFDPQPVENSMIGIGVTLVAIVATLGLITYQRYVVRQTKSLAIAADSVHYRGDLLMNLSVIAALILSGAMGLYWADPLFGAIIAALIAYSAWQIFTAAYDQLMDHELSDEERAQIKDIALKHLEAMDIHDLRTRKSGIYVFIQFHLELQPDISLLKAHTISDEVESAIIKAFPGAEVLIHQDPVGLEELKGLDYV